MPSEQSNDHIEDVIDLEEFAKGNNGGTPPKAKCYRIRVDNEKYDVNEPALTGRQILQLASKSPIERYLLSQKKHGGVVEPIAHDQTIDFTAPGVERFMTLPMDQQDG
jgi:hypothetical protein